MLAAAVIFDLLGCIPIPGFSVVVNLIAMIVLGIVSDHKGMNLYSSERISGTLAAILVDFLPVVPAWTVRVLLAKGPTETS